MDIEAIYAGIVDGSGDGGDLAWTRRDLRQHALHNAKTGDPEARYGALKVAALLGPRDGLPIAHQLVTDPDPRVRTLAFDQAVGARAEGLGTIRAAAGGIDPELACAALDLLIRWVDAQAMTLAWRGLGSPHAGVRQRSAVLLGHVAGQGVTADLRRQVESDADEAAKAAAAEALQRIAGDLPKARREDWWSDPAESESQAGGAPGEAPAASPAETLPARVSTPPERGSQPPEAGRSVAEGEWAALPKELPTEIRALVRLLGMVGPADRGRVAEAVLDCGDTAWSELMLGWARGGDPALGRGLAWSAAALRRAGAVARLEGMLGDPDPSVRAAAADAVGAVGAAGAIPSLARAFGDPVPDVAAAAIRGAVVLALRVERPDVVRDQLRRVGRDVPEEVAAAVAEAHERLG
jgi:HEAT repeat protein